MCVCVWGKYLIPLVKALILFEPLTDLSYAFNFDMYKFYSCSKEFFSQSYKDFTKNRDSMPELPSNRPSQLGSADKSGGN